MKKTIALILALVMIMSLAACGKTEAPEAADPGNEPAAPGEGPEMPSVMPEVGEGDDVVEYPASDSDMPNIEYPSSDSDLSAGDNAALNILNTVWASYDESEKFPPMGGDYENMVMDAPGACGLNDAEALDALFGIPAASLGSVSAAASLMHGMNANTFTSACYQLKDSADADAFATELKDNILARQWMCGFPETLLIMEVEGCVISAFGNGELIENFKNKITSAYPSASLMIEEPIV